MMLFASILLVAGEHLAWGGSFADPTLWQVTNGLYRAWATPGGVFTKPYLASTNGIDWCEMTYGPIDAKLSKEIHKQWRWIWAPDHAIVGDERLFYHSHWRALDDGEKRPRVMLSRRLDWTKDGWPILRKD